MKRTNHQKKSVRKGSAGKRLSDRSTLPQFCDYTCPHSDFAPKDFTGDCRKELAVYCTLLKKFNNKNNRCLARS
ncbi:MAG TPA: hypothetical protein VLY03_12595 [Bacteroidota bacterium]|nr:hypothetical protein [Bacteroidota bacterium]